MTRLRRWWAARPLPLRVGLVVTAVALVGFLALARVSAAVVGWSLAGAVDDELATAVAAAAPAVERGRDVPQPQGNAVVVRVLDRSGSPVDAGPLPSLTAADVRGLLSGEAVWTGRGDPTRWSGRVVTAPDGSQRLVAASAPLVGYGAVLHRSAVLISLAAVAAALVVGAGGGLAAREALRPVDRLRAAAAELPPGERLPVPAAADAVRGLAEALNDLLARRDAAGERMRRFTGDAAHELRSPVAAIRAQAEVALTVPDPDLAAHVAAEAQRLSALLDDLLALARADAGERLPTEPVDVTVCARAAVARGPATVPVRLTAPAPPWSRPRPGTLTGCSTTCSRTPRATPATRYGWPSSPARMPCGCSSTTTGRACPWSTASGCWTASTASTPTATGTAAALGSGWRWWPRPSGARAARSAWVRHPEAARGWWSPGLRPVSA